MNANRALGKGKTVMLDYFFNAETKKDITGHVMPWHYKWEERANGGYSLWAACSAVFGVNTKSLAEAPSAANLKGTDIYIIVDPDTPQESEHPNYIEAPQIRAIVDWVKAGGVLVFPWATTSAIWSSIISINRQTVRHSIQQGQSQQGAR